MNKSLSFYIFKFALYAVGAIVLVYAVMIGIDYYGLTLELGHGAAGALIGGAIGALIGPIAAVGKSFFENEERGPSFSEGFTLSAVFAFIILGLVFGLAFVVNKLYYGAWLGQMDINDLPQEALVETLVIFAAAVLAILTLLFWFMLWASVRGQRKKALRAAQRA